jgi:hypothetical protein
LFLLKINITARKSFTIFLQATLVLFIMKGLDTTAQKTDRIVLQNGNEITGEVKKLEYGKLTYSTNDLGTLSVNWEKVIFIRSNKIFEIKTSQGYLFIGNLEQTADTGVVLIRTGSAGTEVQLHEITYIYPIKKSFFQRISGPVSIGAGYSKASDLLQVTFDGDLSYKGTKIYSGFTASSSFTRQYDSVFTQRQAYSLIAGKNFRKRWYTGGLVGFEQNTELDIQSRTYLGVQTGKSFIDNLSNNLNSSIAVLGTREIYYSEESSTNNIELFFDIKYKRYLYYSPKSDITTELQFLPSLTTWGRIRTNYSIALNQEIFSDFFWNLNFYIKFDNRPTEEDSETTDWGVTTGFGYTF